MTANNANQYHVNQLNVSLGGKRISDSLPQAPDGYMSNSAGHLVPIENIKDIDLLRHELVLEIANRAADLQLLMQQFRQAMTDDVDAFVALSLDKYGIKTGGVKGNISLSSYCGRVKIERSVQNHLQFDERLQAAKELIDRCITRWTQDSNANIRTLITHAFQTDQAGRINTARVLNLTKLDINDADWCEAMRALKDSLSVASTKTYYRVKTRDASGNWHTLSLDIASC